MKKSEIEDLVKKTTEEYLERNKNSFLLQLITMLLDEKNKMEHSSIVVQEATQEDETPNEENELLEDD